MAIRREIWCALSLIGDTDSKSLWFGPWGRNTFDEWYEGWPSWR